MIHVREFTVHTDQRAHYKAVLDRLNRPRRVAPALTFIAPESEPEPEPVDTSPATWIPDGSPDALELYEKILTAPCCAAKATATRMVAEIAEKHGVTLADIMGESRKYVHVRPRYEAIALVATTFKGWSLPILGRFFGRDHTSILHVLRMTGARGCSFPEGHRFAGRGE